MPRVKEIEVSLGISLDVNGSWIKPSAKMSWDVDEPLTVESLEKLFDKSWHEVTRQVQLQISRLT